MIMIFGKPKVLSTETLSVRTKAGTPIIERLKLLMILFLLSLVIEQTTAPKFFKLGKRKRSDAISDTSQQPGTSGTGTGASSASNEEATPITPGTNAQQADDTTTSPPVPHYYWLQSSVKDAKSLNLDKLLSAEFSLDNKISLLNLAMLLTFIELETDYGTIASVDRYPERRLYETKKDIQELPTEYNKNRFCKCSSIYRINLQRYFGMYIPLNEDEKEAWTSGCLKELTGLKELEKQLTVMHSKERWREMSDDKMNQFRQNVLSYRIILSMRNFKKTRPSEINERWKEKDEAKLSKMYASIIKVYDAERALADNTISKIFGGKKGEKNVLNQQKEEMKIVLRAILSVRLENEKLDSYRDCVDIQPKGWNYSLCVFFLKRGIPIPSQYEEIEKSKGDLSGLTTINAKKKKI